MADRDDLTTKRAAAEAAGMRLPLTTDKWGDAIYNGDGQALWTSEAADIAAVNYTIAAANYLVAAANSAPGLEAEVERLRGDLADMTRDRDEWRECHAFEQRNRLEADAERDEAVRGYEGMSVLADELRSERDAAHAEVERLTKESDNWHECWRTELDNANKYFRQASDLRAEVARLTQERDGLLNEVNDRDTELRNRQELHDEAVASWAEEVRRLRGLLREALALADRNVTGPGDAVASARIRREGGLTDE